jgi:hypothetical protein
MLASFRSVKFSVLWRTISIICVMMVFSYILFEVLDLDGSNFPLQRYPVESNAIVPETETNTIRPYLIRLAEPRTEFSFSWLTKHVDWVHLRLIETLTVPGFTQVQRRGYRAPLPRSSIPDL